MWATMSRAQLERGIHTQVPFFKNKKMISEGHEDLDKIADSFPDKSDVSWSLCFSPFFIARLFRAGFLPIAQNIGGTQEGPLYVLMPKMHVKRCVLNIAEFNVQKKIKKHAKHFTISMNTCFDQVLAKCHDQHGENSWLVSPLRKALAHLHQNRKGVSVSLVSVELWRHSDADHVPLLVAGELGVLTGAVYTSLTGFSERKEN